MDRPYGRAVIRNNKTVEGSPGKENLPIVFISGGGCEGDSMTPRADKMALLYRGDVDRALVCRAFFPAYVPGEHAHYGSIVYSLDSHEPDSVFELAYSINRLRAEGAVGPIGTERIASAIRDDRSSFSRLRLPESLGAHGESYFANLCLHKKRLSTGCFQSSLRRKKQPGAAFSRCGTGLQHSRNAGWMAHRHMIPPHLRK